MNGLSKNLCVRDVPARFKAIPQKVSSKSYLSARNDINIPDYERGRKDEHFQGIQRIGEYLILSGSRPQKGSQGSQLIVIKMESHPKASPQSDRKKGPWALPEYGYSYEAPPPEDRIIDVVDIDTQKWHAGGIQAMGEVIAVPIYGDGNGSEVRYFDFKQIKNRSKDKEIPPIMILSRPHSKSKAVAITRLPNDHVMTAVWDDENLEFHYSISTDIGHGFRKTPQVANKSEIGDGFNVDKEGTYQNINFVLDCDKSLYLIATRNKAEVSPPLSSLLGKPDFADLYKILWPDGYESKPQICLVDGKQMYCYDRQCNFGAGAGIYINDEEHLYLYATFHWLTHGNKRLNFNEYSYL